MNQMRQTIWINYLSSGLVSKSITRIMNTLISENKQCSTSLVPSP